MVQPIRSLPALEGQLEEANDSMCTIRLKPLTDIADCRDSEEVAVANGCNEKDPCLGVKAADVLTNPYQPTPSATVGGEFPKMQFGKQQRCFQAARYEKFVWLEYSQQLDAAFCLICLLSCGMQW